MDRVNKKNKTKQLVLGGLPLVFSVLYSSSQFVLFLVAGILSLFFIVGIVPLFKRRESVWMFILVGLTGVPINFSVAYEIISAGLIEEIFPVSGYVWIAMICCALFSLEELAFGIITRIIWPKQIKIRL